MNAEVKYLPGTTLVDHTDGQSVPCVFLGAGERGHILLDTVQSGLPVGTFEQRQQRHFELLLDGMRKHFSSLGMHANLEQWFVTLAQSANPYQTSNDNRRVEIDTLLRLLNKIDARFASDFMQIDGANRVSLKVDGVETQLLHLSTGFTSLVKLLQSIISGYANFTNESDITQTEGLVFIDEIENHLHVKWQSTIILLLKKLFPKTTFFVATHSPIVLSQLQEGEAYLLERSDGMVKSTVIKAPNKRILSDVLVDAMNINLNKLKIDRMSSDSQKEIKARLRELLLATSASTVSGDA
jgi:predicted ATP-dependent endonuclease of OLD family